MSKTMTQVFKTAPEASNAVDRLLELGIVQENISVLMTDQTRGQSFNVEVNSKAPEGIATGGAIGGVLGAIAAGMTAAGTIALTGGAGIIVAGPIAAALAGAGAGAGAGGLIGGLIGMGMDENEAKTAEQALDNGSILLSVEVPKEHKDEVSKILELAHIKDDKAVEATA